MKKENRILTYSEFSEIIGTTKRLKTPHFLINFRFNEENKARIGVSVSKRNGNAVTRNKIKRQIRYIVGKHFDMSRPVDLVIVARVTYNYLDFAQIENELIDVLSNIGE